MPSGVMSDSGALALHYAAARGCLDCVKMLIESPTLDFRYTIIVRVKWKKTNWAHLASGWEWRARKSRSCSLSDCADSLKRESFRRKRREKKHMTFSFPYLLAPPWLAVFNWTRRSSYLLSILRSLFLLSDFANCTIVVLSVARRVNRAAENTMVGTERYSYPPRLHRITTQSERISP